MDSYYDIRDASRAVVVDLDTGQVVTQNLMIVHDISGRR